MLKSQNPSTYYFESDDLISEGLPTVQHIANNLNVSPNYLSGLLKMLTGRSTQQHIHDKLIEKAKELLPTTDQSIGEIAYALGFEHRIHPSKYVFKLSDFSLETVCNVWAGVRVFSGCWCP
jgi:AraC-like DNA-binding protein